MKSKVLCQMMHSIFYFRSIGGEISQDGDFYVFEGNRYRNGFLYKTMAISAIVSGVMILINNS